MGKGDHKVIPKSILRRFLNENKKVWCINLKINKLEEYNVDSIFTEKDYYYDNIDKYIKDNVETQIGNLYKSIIESNKNGEIFHLRREYLKHMREIFFIQFFRNNNIQKDCKSPIFSNKLLHNLTIQMIINFLNTGTSGDLEFDEICNNIDSENKKCTPGFVITKNMKRSFLLPASQFIYFSIQKIDTYMYPIAPEVALIWRKLPNKKEVDCGFTEDENAIEKINKFIIEKENDLGMDCKVFGKEEEIKEMFEIINKKKMDKNIKQ